MAEIKLFNRDCIAAMKDIEDGSIDLIVTEIKTQNLIQSTAA